MRKLLLSSAIVLIAAVTSAQTKSTVNYRVGVATAMAPTTLTTQLHVGLGSSLVEVSCSPKAKKISYTLNTGYFRLNNQDGANVATQVPVLVGARYAVSNTVYFGGSIGTAIGTKKGQGNPDVVFSPYIGMQAKHISLDLRYLNFFKSVSSSKTAALVLSYTL